MAGTFYLNSSFIGSPGFMTRAGWLAFNLHHACDACDPRSIRASVLDQFLAWLQPRSGPTIRTTVKTVQQVVTGSVKAPVAPTPPPPPGGRSWCQHGTQRIAGNPVVGECEPAQMLQFERARDQQGDLLDPESTVRARLRVDQGELDLGAAS
jgi:hypothetical protein